MSVESKKLKPFEQQSLQEVITRLLPKYRAVASSDYFSGAEFDGVAVSPSGGLAVLEVALGGKGAKLASGPMRKMMTDAFKLLSAQYFLKQQCQIERKILVVRTTVIAGKLVTGWKKTALASADIEVVSAIFTKENIAEIEEILARCAEEQIQDFEVDDQKVDGAAEAEVWEAIELGHPTTASISCPRATVIVGDV